MSDATSLIVSIMLLIGSLLFVAAEYALISCRRSRIETLAKRGHRAAQTVLKLLDNPNKLVAGAQIGITMIGVAVGSITEPFLTSKLQGIMGQVPQLVSFAISYTFITYVLVVGGELIPKYMVIRNPEPWALLLIIPLSFVAKLFSPLVWLAQVSAAVVLRPFGVVLDENKAISVAREEIEMLIKAGQGDLDEDHADYVSRALRLDQLDAKDIMIHRLDIKFLDVNTPPDQLLGKVSKIPHTRLPVCRGDIDDVVGIAYLNDIVKALGQPELTLEKILRPAVIVPESLTVDRIVARMRSERTQILIVCDEYGGTSGLITLEDVVEEVFGDLEDRIEADRPAIERFPSGRISAKSDVRFDELIRELDFDMDGASTETLAEMFSNGLGRVPRIGDQLETPIGKMRVENITRRRITRVSIRLKSR